MVSLGKIEKLDVRDVWSREDQDFTPWLAENLSLLGEALGMDIELEEREAPVGRLSLDILAREVGSDRPVIIENQLEQTDHTHLGQLLTYAACYDANVVVWIARKFNDQHRAALDWLNERTSDETSFFAVAVELWRIDGSRPAVNFNLVSTPNEWRRDSTTTGVLSSRGASEIGERYRDYWQGLIDTLRENHSFTNRRTSHRFNYFYFTIGFGQRVRFATTFPTGGRSRVEVYIDSGEEAWNKSIFDELEARKESIESELSDSLEWDRLDGAKACRISSVRNGRVDDDPDTLENTRQWMIRKLLDFKQVFGPHLEELV